MSKRAKIHKLKNAPKPYLSTPSGSADVLDPKWQLAGPSLSSRWFVVESAYAYHDFCDRLLKGQVHIFVDGVGESWLRPADNWQDVLAAFIGKKEF